MSDKDWMERIAELVIEDKELHDAIVRLINAMATEKEEKVARMQTARIGKKHATQQEDVSIQ